MEDVRVVPAFAEEAELLDIELRFDDSDEGDDWDGDGADPDWEEDDDDEWEDDEEDDEWEEDEDWEEDDDWDDEIDDVDE